MMRGQNNWAAVPATPDDGTSMEGVIKYTYIQHLLNTFVQI